MRILSDEHVRELLPMQDCIEIMRRTFRVSTEEKVVNPLRNAMLYPDKSGLLGMMPAYLEEPRCCGIKVVTVTPGNHGTKYDAHQGAVLLFEVEHGTLIGVFDASSITAIRTAAASAVATDLLAHPQASIAAIIGSGVQAQTHIEAVCAVRDITEIRIHSRNFNNAEKLAHIMSDRQNLPIKAVKTAEEAVRGAHVVCTTTASTDPVFFSKWLEPGMHLNAVGACMRKARELDSETVKRSRLFVDRRESAENESGDYLIPLNEGCFGPEHLLGEIGDVLLDRVPGRTSFKDITLFKSLGFGVEDIATAQFLYEASRAQNVGLEVDFGGQRDLK